VLFLPVVFAKGLFLGPGQSNYYRMPPANNRCTVNRGAKVIFFS